MVLQQQTNATIWGWADPSDTVSVITSWDQKTYKTKSLKKCRNHKFNFDLKLEPFLGVWYPVAMTKNFDHKADCIELKFNYVSNNKVLVGYKDTRKPNNEVSKED